MENYHCNLCNSDDYEKIISITKKPIGETDFKIPPEKYYREICKCNNCGVYFNKHLLLNENFYNGYYNNANAMGTLKKRFSKIITLPFADSDNKRRVQRIIKFLIIHNFQLNKCKILDVGSGTGVFLYEMKKKNIQTFCIDPDNNSVQHALNNIKVDGAYHGTIDNYVSKNKFELITFNKVLEHIKNPIPTLMKAKQFLLANGLIYIELPYADTIFKDKDIEQRSEFFIEHYTIHNKESIKKIAELADLKILKVNNVIDPSGKHTIYAFLSHYQ